MTRRDQTLYLDPDDKMVGGVCSGLGHYFDIDTTLVRVAFVVLAMLGGGGLLGYVILWLVLDPAPPGYWGGATRTDPDRALGEGDDPIDLTGSPADAAAPT
jgi:phage shock protein PspC (stress-responsive transcriptional regulator)